MTIFYLKEENWIGGLMFDIIWNLIYDEYILGVNYNSKFRL